VEELTAKMLHSGATASTSSINRNPRSGSASRLMMATSGSDWETTSTKKSYREHSASSHRLSSPRSIVFNASRLLSVGSTMASRSTLFILRSQL